MMLATFTAIQEGHFIRRISFKNSLEKVCILLENSILHEYFFIGFTHNEA